MFWRADPDACDLLERLGGPFERRAFRAACVEVTPTFADASFGARAADGTRAAVALLVDRTDADGVPFGYGGIRATTSLDPRRQIELLELARTACGARRLVVRSLVAPGDEPLGRQIATTAVCPMDAPPGERIEKRGRQSIRRAERAGCVVRPTTSSEAFLRLHRTVSRIRPSVYPEALLRLLAERGELQFYDVAVGGEVVSSLAALTRGTHWMYWLAAQSERGRELEAGYPAVAALLDDAYSSEGVEFVNLGASERLPGVAAFKHRLGGVDWPVVQVTVAPAQVRVRETITRTLDVSAGRLRAGVATMSRRLGLR